VKDEGQKAEARRQKTGTIILSVHNKDGSVNKVEQDGIKKIEDQDRGLPLLYSFSSFRLLASGFWLSVHHLASFPPTSAIINS
jgi:hypothetical protein